MQIHRKVAIAALLAIMLAALSFSASAELKKEGEITLLALSVSDANTTGTTAILNLELRDGGERVFLHTFPLTKISTQISMRFAQQIGCREFEIDCSGYDFIYTLSAAPGIVGGPSAGAAAAVLTVALLKDLALDEKMTITGTINSGGVIGSVGGLKEKIKAAAEEGLAKVLIPKGQAFAKEENATEDLVEFGRRLGLEVIEVATLGEAVFYFTGLPMEVIDEELKIESAYLDQMKSIAEETCQKSAFLDEKIIRLVSNSTQPDFERARNYTTRASEQMKNKKYYSAASYCFRANIKYKRILYDGFSVRQAKRKLSEYSAQLEEMESQLNASEITTFTELQTYMLVKERIVEAGEAVSDVEGLEQEQKDDAADLLAYIEERIYSATTWSEFFNVAGKPLVIDSESIKSACTAKLAEAEERQAYAQSLIPIPLMKLKEEIELAYSYANNNHYELCLFSASKAKAEADAIITSVGVEEDLIEALIGQKLELAKNALIKAQKRGFLPLIAYSYYEYSGTLKEEDFSASMLFAEHALELAALDRYFDSSPMAGQFNSILEKESLRIPKEVQLAFAAGFLIGVLLASLVVWRKRKAKKNRRKSTLPNKTLSSRFTSAQRKRIKNRRTKRR